MLGLPDVGERGETKNAPRAEFFLFSAVGCAERSVFVALCCFVCAFVFSGIMTWSEEVHGSRIMAPDAQSKPTPGVRYFPLGGARPGGRRVSASALLALAGAATAALWLRRSTTKGALAPLVRRAVGGLDRLLGGRRKARGTPKQMAAAAALRRQRRSAGASTSGRDAGVQAPTRAQPEPARPSGGKKHKKKNRRK